MGNYLDMVNNDKPDPVAGTAPNENYGREVLQLFSIGVHQLNLDGTPQLDGDGNPIPAYDQDTIEGFSHTFTGWTYPTRPGKTGYFGNPEYYGGPMIAFDEHHDTGPKELLNGVVLSAGGTAKSDLKSAIQNIFNHPNVGPFIGKQLIQHLVTSNPSPDYVARVAAVFNDNGKGVRGDLKAVVRAILLDPEARRGDDPAQAQADDGHLKEPLLFMMNLLRAGNAIYLDSCLANYASDMRQEPFYSPISLQFLPSRLPARRHESAGSGIRTARYRHRRGADQFRQHWYMDSPCGSTKVDFSPFQVFAGNPGQLVDTIASVMLHGHMSADMRSTLVSTISGINQPDERTKAALYLIGSSSQFQVQH